MKIFRGRRTGLLVLVLLTFTVLWFVRYKMPGEKPSFNRNGPQAFPALDYKVKRPKGNVRASDMMEWQRTELAKKFQEKFKPAITKWCQAYEGHISFHAEDVTLDKFHS